MVILSYVTPRLFPRWIAFVYLVYQVQGRGDDLAGSITIKLSSLFTLVSNPPRPAVAEWSFGA